MSTTNGANPTGFMSYEDYLKDSEYMKNAQKNAKNVLDKSVIEANTSYKQALATYGANAEALGRMGLTGSGYSDYLTGQAYAQQRADINAANAQYNKTMSAAGYQDYLNYKTEAENYKNNYLSLYNDVLTGKYGASDIESIAAKYGIAPGSDLDNLKTAAGTYESNKQSQLYATFLGELYENGYSTDEIKTLAEAGGLTDDNGYLTKLGEAALNYNKKNSTVSGSDIPRSEDGTIDDTSEAYIEYNKQESEKIKSDMFDTFTYADGLKLLNDIIADKYLDGPNGDNVKAYFKSTYGIDGSASSVIAPKIVNTSDVQGFDTGKGYNLRVYIDGTKYKLENKGAAGTVTAKQLSNTFGKDVKNHTVVSHNGNFYIFYGAKWYRLGVRSNETDGQKESWAAFKEAANSQ